MAYFLFSGLLTPLLVLLGTMCHEFRLSRNLRQALQLGWTGNPGKRFAGWPNGKRVHPPVAQSVYSLAPGIEYPFSGP